MITGIEGDVLESKIRMLGGDVTEDATKCTHLITDKVRRTAKFLACMSSALYICDYTWITESSEKGGKFLEETPFLLKDAGAESKHKFKLSSRSFESRFLEGKQVYCTPGVRPGRPEMKLIVGAAGGKVTSCPRKYDENTIVISCEEDAKKHANLIKLGYSIYTNEVILTGALRQKLQFLKAWTLHKGKK